MFTILFIILLNGEVHNYISINRIFSQFKNNIDVYLRAQTKHEADTLRVLSWQALGFQWEEK